MTETGAQITDHEFPDLRKPSHMKDFGMTIKSGLSKEYFSERGNFIVSPRKH